METDYSVKRGEFSWALEQLKRGKKVKRNPWVSTYLQLIGESETFLAFIAMRFTTDERIVPWTPTHADLLADDWVDVDG